MSRRTTNTSLNISKELHGNDHHHEEDSMANGDDVEATNGDHDTSGEGEDGRGEDEDEDEHKDGHKEKSNLPRGNDDSRLFLRLLQI